MKYNLSNGAPAPESVTNKIFEKSKQLTEYKSVEIPKVNLSKIGTEKYGPLEVEIIDSTTDYMEMLRDIFDFPLIKSFLEKDKDFKVIFDALHGVTGPYFLEIQKELGLPTSSCQVRVISPTVDAALNVRLLTVRFIEL